MSSVTRSRRQVRLSRALGLALTPKGRALYDSLLARAREADGAGSTGDYGARLVAAFDDFPDDDDTLRREGLGYYRYALTDAGRADPSAVARGGVDDAISAGLVTADPVVYEDFLPVSAAGIFQSNLGGGEQRAFAAQSNRDAFETALGAQVHDEFEIYAAVEQDSRRALGF